MARIFHNADGTISVWGDWLNDEPLPANATLLAQYIEANNQVIHNQISAESAIAAWNAQTQELTINGVVKIDGAWIAERQAEIAAATSATSSKQTILANAAKAHNHAPAIADLFAESTEQDEAGTTVIDTLLAAYRAEVAAQSPAFRAVFLARLTAFGIPTQSFNDNTLTANQKVIACLWYDLFSLKWSFMLSVGQ